MKYMLLLFASLFLFSCTKEHKVYHVNPELASWFNYGEGSYVIMKDIDSNTFDSIIFSYDYRTNFTASETETGESLEKGFDIYARGLSSKPKGYWLYVISTETATRSGAAFSVKDTPNNWVVYSPFLTIPFQADGKGRYEPFPAVHVTLLPTFQVGAFQFTDVYHVEYITAGSQQKEEIWFDKHVGIIKIIENNDVYKKSLEIVSWHIN
jgi:hypothetical protein